MTSAGGIREYAYATIKSDQFRVIEVQGFEPDIRISLVEHSDDSPPEYFALSYTWGFECNTEHILCDGKTFRVTPHLKEGLQSICNTCGSSNLWVDAICINQKSDVEKEMQVAKMHEIYQKAKAVYVWLGPAKDGSDKAITAINQVRLDEILQKPLSEALLKFKSEAPHLFDMALFGPLAALSRRTWFRRLWIAQEYFYGRSVKFICGRSVSEGNQFVGVLMKLTINSFGAQDPPNLRDEEEDLFTGYATLRELDMIKEKHCKSDDPIFFDFVMLNRQRFGKEPVDRIYAAFGMAKGTDEVYRKGIPIDYSEDAKINYWRLYVTFGKIAFQHEPHLRLLSMVSSKERPDQLPSWCPNLNSTGVTGDIDSTNVHAAGWPWREHGRPDGNRDLDSPRCNGHPNFKGGTENHVLIFSDSDTISIWGASLGCIKAIGSPCEWNADIDIESLSSIKPFAKEFLKWLFKNEKFCKDHSENEKTALHVHGQILVGATNEKRRVNKLKPEEEREALGMPISEPYKHSKSTTQSNDAATPKQPEATGTSGKSKEMETTEIYDLATDVTEDEISAEHEKGKRPGSNSNLEETYGRDLGTLFMISTLFRILELNKDEDWLNQDSQLMGHFEMAYSWIMRLSDSWEHRVQFVTENGHFGYASEDVKVGDHVCMLYGGRSLFILRKEAKSYSFISDAYVFNCVNGEIFEMLDEGLVKEELFPIS